MRRSLLLAASALTLASWSASLPAIAQGIVPGSTTSAPGATTRGIKDNGVTGCGNCGLHSRAKNRAGVGGGPRAAPKAQARTEG